MTVTASVCAKCQRELPLGARFCPGCGASIERAPLPQRLQAELGDDFDVIGELGRGGFAIVYSVKQRSSGQYLAVKVVREKFMISERVLERFRREIKYVENLDHPNILTIAFSAETAELAFCAMPRVKGKTLREIIKNGPLLMDDVFRVLRDVGSGLQHAHERGIVHRDVKPSNIMIDETVSARILDFGIAKALSTGDGSLSISGEIVGTPEYVSPEQADGNTSLDHRSDQYSLGIVGFEMLAGRPPFLGEPRRLFYDQIFTPAPDVREFRPETPANLAVAIARCLEKEPNKRWPSMTAAAGAGGFGPL